MCIEIPYLILLFLLSHLASSVVDGYLVRLFNYVSFNNTTEHFFYKLPCANSSYNISVFLKEILFFFHGLT